MPRQVRLIAQAITCRSANKRNADRHIVPGPINLGSGFVVREAFLPIILVRDIWIASVRCEAPDTLLGRHRAEIEDLISIF
jgi:hypothetical protein